MFRTFQRIFLPNPFDAKLKKCAKKGGKKVLLGWNRGLGDIALGLYAMIQRIRELIPDAEITFLTRPNLKDGFSLLKNIEVLIDPDLQRGQCWDLKESLHKIGKEPKSYDLLIPKPSPTDWVPWQRGKITPRLKWREEELWKKFDLPDGYTYIGVQCVVETSYASWRNWPVHYWEQLFTRLEGLPHVKVILLGGDEKTTFQHKNIIDLRGKTTLFELLSVVRYRCSSLILPDSGILSMVYYLDLSFPIHLITLWGDPDHGVLKQAVASPNRYLKHTPMIGAHRDLSTVTVDQMMNTLFPPKPVCSVIEPSITGSLERVGALILAGGQGSRLGHLGPKGTFEICGKSLFERICEKAPSKDFPIAVMTSPLNHTETVKFFEKHNYFGKELYFFQQETTVFLNEKKRSTRVAVPAGNGSVYGSFAKSGLLDQFKKKGIEYLTIVPVENVLADIADQKLIGHARGYDVTLKCIERESPMESMGALVEREGKIEIVEYLDLDTTLNYRYSYTGMMAISLSFFEKMKDVSLPVHWVKKNLPGTKQWGWKGEKFIFDALPFARTNAVCFAKKDCYAPIKNIDSIETIKDSLK